MVLKICAMCNKWFEKNGQNQKHCKDCMVIARQRYKRKWFENNQDKMREYVINNRDIVNNVKYRWRRRNLRKAASYARASQKSLKDSKCSVCGEIENLEFHHTDYEKDEGYTLCCLCHKWIHNYLRS